MERVVEGRVTVGRYGRDEALVCVDLICEALQPSIRSTRVVKEPRITID